MKKCSRCGLEKPESEFADYMYRHKGIEVGLRKKARCKECAKDYQKIYQGIYYKRRKAASACPRCGGPKARHARQCRKCHFATLECAPKATCMDCGKPLSVKTSKRCRACAQKVSWNSPETIRKVIQGFERRLEEIEGRADG